MSEQVKLAMDYCVRQHQEHLLDYLRPVFSDKSDFLAKQIIKTDFTFINELYKNLLKNPQKSGKKNVEFIKPINSFDLTAASERQKEELTGLGLDCIISGEAAAITMAGGQGTRLGHTGPKGTFLLNANPPKSLFEIQSERLLEVFAKTDVYIPWLIMTSEENNDATMKYFKQNNYFCYDPLKVHFFEQEMLPVFDTNGKVLVNESGLIFGPNGNGGLFSSLMKSGEYQWLRDQGIRKVFVCGIDNVLVKVADPLFIGFSIQAGKAISCKSAYKRSYDEKAGVFCYKNNKPFYVEYTEISEEDAKAADENGRFLYGDIGIVMYIFDIDIIEKISLYPLPYHVAKKRTPYILPSGEQVKPSSANSIKFESFIFDSFEKVEDISILRILREEEFAPVKNLTGEDSPVTAIEMYKKIYGTNNNY